MVKLRKRLQISQLFLTSHWMSCMRFFFIQESLLTLSHSRYLRICGLSTYCTWRELAKPSERFSWVKRPSPCGKPLGNVVFLWWILLRAFQSHYMPISPSVLLAMWVTYIQADFFDTGLCSVSCVIQSQIYSYIGLTKFYSAINAATTRTCVCFHFSCSRLNPFITRCVRKDLRGFLLPSSIIDLLWCAPCVSPVSIYGHYSKRLGMQWQRQYRKLSNDSEREAWTSKMRNWGLYDWIGEYRILLP